MREIAGDYIFSASSQNPTQQIEKHTSADNNMFYTIEDHAEFKDENGNHRLSSDGQYVYAKKILREDESIKYSVKTDTKGKLFNPISIYGQEKTNNFLDKTCKDTKFRTVNFKTFEMYIKFLNTKNLSWLHNAEREAE